MNEYQPKTKGVEKHRIMPLILLCGLCFLSGIDAVYVMENGLKETGHIVGLTGKSLISLAIILSLL
ncbi:MAG: hypothetical protein OXC67_10905 [Flavobacteriaceae bacterium]|nr:hypothetical protein [Flavobacteriaceae bacterium]